MKIGPREYFTQLLYIGDTKAGTLVGVDQFGNKYYENKEEIFGRDRWVDYVQHYGDASQIPPEWHSWIHKITDTPPTIDPPPRPKFAQRDNKENRGDQGSGDIEHQQANLVPIGLADAICLINCNNKKLEFKPIKIQIGLVKI
ncbi:9637_t:CDS:2 [Dentiscutata erythropus]|uniref:NADH dehydrogenase [ubiquinone] 1 alpha subcomplex subunit n=1 Tax=Dentiscutata erythropus TaxID=1348616 RepID=A0A9N9HWY6_9GLOM|nr:9637_t:CDS:2 [Dentiscutata erythropus]